MAMTTWTTDPMHSDVQFKVKHLMIATVTGSFTSFRGAATTEGDDFTTGTFTFSADTASINTGIEQRDQHLKSDDFFNAEKFPTLSFTSTSIVSHGDSTYTLIGMMTIRDITKEVSLRVEYGGTMTDFYGNTKAGFEISGILNRKDFHLNWSAVTEAGGVVVSDEVRLVANIQLTKNTETASA